MNTAVLNQEKHVFGRDLGATTVGLDKFENIDNFDELALEHWQDFNTKKPEFKKEMLKNILVVTARCDEKVVGYLFFVIFSSPYYDEKWCQADMFYLKRSHRGNGVGKQMFTLMAEIAKKFGCSKVLSSSNLKGPLDGFYENLGYTATHCLFAKEI